MYPYTAHPCPARPGGSIVLSLMGALAFYSSVVMVAHYMIGAIVRAEMMFHGSHGMGDGYLPVFVVASEFTGTEEQV